MSFPAAQPRFCFWFSSRPMNLCASKLSSIWCLYLPLVTDVFSPRGPTKTQPFQLTCSSLVFFSHCKFGSVGSMAEGWTQTNLCPHSHSGDQTTTEPQVGPTMQGGPCGLLFILPKVSCLCCGRDVKQSLLSPCFQSMLKAVKLDL